MKTSKHRLLLLVLSTLLLSSCAGNNNNESPTSEEVPSISQETTSEETVSPRFKADFAFSKFKDGGTEISETIVDGLTHYTHTMTKENGNKVQVHSLEVDLSKVAIDAGTAKNASIKFNNTKNVPYQSALDMEEKTGKTVYASLNADFFGSQVVNAFVKDGYVVKSSHNDNGNYDYTNSSSDVPASYPMLFGIKNGVAQVAPILSNDGKDPKEAANKKRYVQASLNYSIKLGSRSIETNNNIRLSSEAIRIAANDSYFDLDISKGLNRASVTAAESVTAVTKLPAPATDHIYLIFGNQDSAGLSFAGKIGVGNTLSITVHSPDGIWDGAETILGCRQEIIRDNEIVSTVSLENTNGCQNVEVPRSAVGVREDGTVVIYAVESLYYGKKSTSEEDPHGVSLPELAEYMSYNNILNGANFDGGGSTQMVLKKARDATPKVVVRSSDTGSSEPLNTRAVMNAILVRSK